MTHMQSPVGTWTLVIATPIGKQHVTLRILDHGNNLEGTATQGPETVPLVDTKRDGARLTWTQKVTKPMKLTIRFDVIFDETRMTGTAKAGVLPGSKVEGIREQT
jgi:hypothetical protein